jgi:hypothetical protein
MSSKNRIAALRARHKKEVLALVRGALRDAGWNLHGAAALLGAPVSTVQWIVEHDEALNAERVRRRPEVEDRRTGRPALDA